MRIMVPLIMAGDPNWLPQALASRLSLYMLAWLLLLIPLTAVLVKLVLQLASQRRQAGSGREHQLHQNERGTAMIEFALVLPILLFMMLLLAQVTLLAAGNLHVHYAGYTATRTAIVQIPLDQSTSGGSGPNVIRTSENDSKFSMIQRAGALACLPISGRESGGDVDAQPLLQGLRDYFSSLNRAEEPWVAQPLGDRLNYAFNHTFITLAATQVNADGTVSVLPLADGQSHTYAPRDAVTVRLVHELNLSVPYVRAFFADGTHDNGRFANVLAQFTLINEGDPTELPETPTLERVP